MNASDLREAIAIEREEIEFSIAGIVRLRESIAVGGEPDPDKLAAISTYLHNAYTGVENILARLSKHRGVTVPNGIDWHAQLLQSFHDGGDDVRLPRFLDDELKAYLDDLRGFRHVFRNKYARQITWSKLESVAAHADASLARFFEALDDLLSRDE